MIENTLATTGLGAHFLDLEITESIAIQDAEFTRNLMLRLRDMGVCLSMDDFGTGYSSLSYLTKFPIDTLKIDQSFIRSLDGESRGGDIIKAVITLARAFDMNVIAEGVETAEQLEFLRTSNCEVIQGYYVSRPMPVQAATEFLKSWPQQREKLLSLTHSTC
jgi:EAL domain-containing protein (putative c-di-GMP-specific phosphodiesterase class I)